MNKVQVKVCGITRIEDGLAAQRAGAEMIGFVFAQSPRSIEPAEAKLIAGQLSCKKVGVFVNESACTINQIALECGLDYVQLHGNESQSDCDAIIRPVIKAIRVQGRADVERAMRFKVFRILFDAHLPTAFGGTGTPVDWALLEGLEQPYILAGGLGPDNVGQAVARLAPWGVDASSRLESAPGIKDHAKLTAFVAAAKGAIDVAR
ncbi:MAG: phosphoribosylanthranilate isomerase [Candidatus Alcyoniella australis]|nr:phosphoribosylanthranilate isomerase [Candidatus Alcyoniella australis]